MSENRNKEITSVGRRKTATARIILSPGTGKMLINGRLPETYFSGVPRFQENIIAPFLAINGLKQYDIKAIVTGGGIMAQSEAIRHGISRALSSLDVGFKSALKKKGYLTRDARAVERKKPGKAKARKSFQWTKR